MNTRIAISGLFLLAALALISCERKQKDPSVIQSKDGKFIFVLHGGADKKLVPPMMKLMEANAQRIKSDLGVVDTTPYSVHIRTSVKQYDAVMMNLIGMSYPGSTAYAAGTHRAELLVDRGVVQAALHEYAHSMSLFIQPRWFNRPRWLWEALALYESGEFIDPETLPYLVAGDFPTIDEMDADFNSGPNVVYETGYLVFEFMKETWSMERIRELIRQTGNIKKVLGITEEEFHKRWMEFVTKKYFGAVNNGQ